MQSTLGELLAMPDKIVRPPSSNPAYPAILVSTPRELLVMPCKIVRPPSSQHVKSARSLPWRIMLLHINPSILIESARSLRVEKLQIQCNRAYLGTCGEKVLTRRGEERIPRMQEVLIEEWEKISVEEINHE